jgi:hypothetical protein
MMLDILHSTTLLTFVVVWAMVGQIVLSERV